MIPRTLSTVVAFSLTASRYDAPEDRARLFDNIPLTRDNHLDYYPTLVSRALEHLGIE